MRRVIPWLIVAGALLVVAGIGWFLTAAIHADQQPDPATIYKGSRVIYCVDHWYYGWSGDKLSCTLDDGSKVFYYLSDGIRVDE